MGPAAWVGAVTLPNTAAGDSWRVHPSWWPTVTTEVAKPYFAELRARVVVERAAGTVPVYPPPHLVFAALQVPLGQVKVVIVGQDPYHGPGQAHGLAFSVPPGVAPPPSLRNILAELQDDVGVVAHRQIPAPSTGPTSYASGTMQIGDLSPWARRGVLLLNTCLTVRAGAAGSHRAAVLLPSATAQDARDRVTTHACGPQRGWERFTNAVLTAVSKQPRPIAWLLWGAAARHAAEDVFGARIPTTASAGAQRDTGAGAWHYVLTAPHPSPLAGRSGATFAGNRHFSRANAWLVSQGAEPIDWSLTP